MEIINFINKINSFSDTIVNFLISIPLPVLKIIGLFFSLVATFLMIFYWIKYEKETKDEINYWKTLVQNIKDFSFMQKANLQFKTIQKTFYQNKIQGLIAANQFLDAILNLCGYEGTLEEKLPKTPKEIVTNLEEIQKACQIVKLIEERISKNKAINLTDEELLLVFHEYEKFFLNFNILTTDDFLVKNLK